MMGRNRALQESATEASAREHELKKALETLRSNASEELTDAKNYLQTELSATQQLLRVSEEGDNNAVLRRPQL